MRAVRPHRQAFTAASCKELQFVVLARFKLREKITRNGSFRVKSKGADRKKVSAGTLRRREVIEWR